MSAETCPILLLGGVLHGVSLPAEFPRPAVGGNIVMRSESEHGKFVSIYVRAASNLALFDGHLADAT